MYDLSTPAKVAGFVRMAEDNLRDRLAREKHEAYRETCWMLGCVIGAPVFGVICCYLGKMLSLPCGISFSAEADPIFGGIIGAVCGVVVGLGVGWSAGLLISDGLGYWLRTLKGRNKIYAVVIFALACVAVFGFYARLGVLVSVACMVLFIFWFMQGGGKFIDWFAVVVLMFITVAVLHWGVPKLVDNLVKNAGPKPAAATEAVEEAK